MEPEHAIEANDGFVSFFRMGDGVKGEFHCSDCGYGVTICRTLPRCPMCGGQTWEQAARSPLHGAIQSRADRA